MGEHGFILKDFSVFTELNPDEKFIQLSILIEVVDVVRILPLGNTV